MKVLVKHLHPNPFAPDRELDEGKVQQLVRSMRHNKVWPGLGGRPHPDKPGEVQCWFGRHRLKALGIVLGPDGEIDLPVEPLTDDQMIQRMADENSPFWRMPPDHRLDMVRRVRDRLKAHPPTKRRGAHTNAAPGAKSIAQYLRWNVKTVSSYLDLLVKEEKGLTDPTVRRSLPTLEKQREWAARAQGLPVNEQKIVAEMIGLGEPLEKSERDPMLRETGGDIFTGSRQRAVNLAEPAVRDAAKKLAIAYRAVLRCPGQLQAVLSVKSDWLDHMKPPSLRQLLAACAELTQVLTKVREWLVQQEQQPNVVTPAPAPHRRNRAKT